MTQHSVTLHRAPIAAFAGNGTSRFRVAGLLLAWPRLIYALAWPVYKLAPPEQRLGKTPWTDANCQDFAHITDQAIYAASSLPPDPYA